ncbi:MAG: hypothetical protein AAF442_08605 [Pseudomonadota bacterium]
MLDTLWTAADFKKKITALEGSKGVGKTAGNIPAKLDAYHAALKKQDWRGLGKALKTLEKDFAKYQKSPQKTIKAVPASDKDRQHIINEWQYMTDGFARLIAITIRHGSQMNDGLSDLEQALTRTSIDLQDLEDFFRKKGLTDAACFNELKKYLAGPIREVERALDTLLPYHESWLKKKKTIASLAILGKKPLAGNQLGQATRAIAAALKTAQP